MSVTVELPEDALARLRAEASRRGVDIDSVIAELASALPSEPRAAVEHKLSIIGIGHSGLGDLARRHREMRAEQTDGSSARDS